MLAIFMLAAGLVVPANLVSPSVAMADPGVCKWDYLVTPLVVPTRNDIVHCSELHDMAVGNDDKTIVVTARTTNNRFYYSSNDGRSFSGSKWNALNREPQWPAGARVYSVAIAPDDPKFYAVTSDVAGGVGPREVWVTRDTGSNWELTNLNLPAGETIRCIDISVDYGGKRDIAVGTVTGTGAGRLIVIQSIGLSGWQVQNTVPLGAVDFFALKFSPSYSSDASLAVVFADANATYYNIAQRDLDQNTTLSWAFTTLGIEVRDPTWGTNSSPSFATLNKADLELPSDFSGQAASLRRAYISVDSYGAAGKASTDRDGIFRIDDTTAYTLMDTSNVVQKSIYSIAYFGSYASGKLLAGERMGSACTATVPTWFTDSPTTCPIPCWYPALKPTTGAANQGACALGVGAAVVSWNSTGKLGLVITGSQAVTTVAGWFNIWLAASVCDDESAFAISRNNGETWNQLALIDTTIDQLTDVQPTPDCKTVYLASVSRNQAPSCSDFDSVWRSSSNADVVSPLPANPIGDYWERVFTHVTAPDCTYAQTDAAILRLVPYCADPSGQIVAWGVYDHNHIFTHGVAAWSPDFGDYWASITVRDPIQDFTFESQTVMYFLNPDGGVQKMPYTGTAWSTALSTVDSIIYGAHSIAAFPEGKVLVGAATGYHASLYAVSYALNFNTDNPSFTVQSMAGRTPFYGDVHVAFDINFSDTNTYFANDENYLLLGGSVYRNNPQAQSRWSDSDMLDAANGAVGCFTYGDPQTGLVLGFTGGALYSSYWEPVLTDGVVTDNSSGVYRTIPADARGNFGPLSGMPKPGIAWDDLRQGLDRAPLSVEFTLQPTALKACGCCSLDTDSTLYAIDNANYNVTNRRGLVWAFTDCLAKRGPALVTEDKTLIGCDPVSGRAQEVNLCWEQLCVADAYDIEIGKDADFTIKVIDWVTENQCTGFLEPADLQTPCVYFPAGGEAFTLGSTIAAWGNLECGHTYYWRVKVRECATQQVIRSPWSEVRSFTVKAGLPVVSPYLGLKLLAPNNGCLGCPVQPVSFSWSPFKETTKYKFQLATDSGMTQLVRDVDLPTTAYEYYDTLDYSTNYFWRVQAVEPAPSDWSATFSFQTEAKPVPVETTAGPTPTPVWVWVVIAIGAILVIVTLVLIFKTRRV
jgi:hypothetical protein